MPGGEHMKVPKKISYSEDVDILMIQLSNKKVDDSYETDDMIVSVTEDGEPVLLEIFNGKRYLKELGRITPKNLKREIWEGRSSTAIPHKIK